MKQLFFRSVFYRICSTVTTVLSVYYSFFAIQKNYLLAGILFVVALSCITLENFQNKENGSELMKCLDHRPYFVSFLIGFGLNISVAFLALTPAVYFDTKAVISSSFIIGDIVFLVVLSGIYLSMCKVSNFKRDQVNE